MADLCAARVLHRAASSIHLPREDSRRVMSEAAAGLSMPCTFRSGRAAAAVSTYSSDLQAKRLNLENAVNSGVMVIDLALWRSRNVPALCFRWLVEHPGLAR